MPLLGDLASNLSLELRGDPNKVVNSLAPLHLATEDQLSFVSEKRHLSNLQDSLAGAVILRQDWLDQWEGCALISEHPYLMYARVSQLFDNHPRPSESIDSRAFIAESVEIGSGVTIDVGACIEQDVVLGDRVWIGAGAYIGRGTVIGADTIIKPRVVVCHNVTIGERCKIHPNTTIGADGFGFASGPDGWEKIEQLASVTIGNDVEIGANSAIDRGALEDTVIGDGVIIDNLVQIAHGVQVGSRTAIASQAGISGSTKVGARCVIAGQVGMAGHLCIADEVHIGGQGRVASSVTEPGHYSSGTPIQPLRTWLRNASRFKELDQIARRITDLEKEVGLSQREKKAR